ncbi:MAG: hypothetical protein KIT74_01645 [Fimbriimonadales bacterium]|nr:hypothetical protein [Fimbriimonadales bacterium]
MKKIVGIALALTLTAFALAQTAWTIRGGLAPQTFHYYDVWLGAGMHEVDVLGQGFGDLDIYVYDNRGRLIVKDDMLDNEPYVRFYLPSGQTMRVVVENASWNYAASYTGIIR